MEKKVMKVKRKTTYPLSEGLKSRADRNQRRAKRNNLPQGLASTGLVKGKKTITKLKSGKRK